MHVMLAPEVLCRLLAGDPQLSRDAREYIGKARMVSVPACAFSILVDWQASGRITGEPLEILELLESQGVLIVPLTTAVFRQLYAFGWAGAAAPDTPPLAERLLLAQAATASATLLTENLALSQFAPGHSLWMPANPHGKT